ncbi:MAG TPA: hypothetical protein VEI97_03515, partial [bacterium]|nr:hypothetical protein [bacterium]
MHLRAFLAASVGAVLLAGCGTGSPTAPGGYQAAALPTIQSFSDGSGMTIGTLGLFRLHVDAATMAATVEPIRTRIAQDNDDLYQLAINSFLGSDTLTVQDIDLDGDSLDLTYAITHPFDAPTNLAGPATAANRADLGVAGMVCLLADVDDAAGNTYFDASPDVVIANTDAIANADGYYRPAGLFDTGGTIANTFPYKLLVDETLDPRTGRDGT